MRASIYNSRQLNDRVIDGQHRCRGDPVKAKNLTGRSSTRQEKVCYRHFYKDQRTEIVRIVHRQSIGMADSGR